MSNLPAAQPTRVPATERDKPKRLEVPPKAKAVIRLMIEQGMSPLEAARTVGYSTKRMWSAFGKPNVLAYLKAERQVFRAAISSANDFRLAAIRDQDDNKSAAVQAVRALERMTEHDDAAPATNERPGLVVVVNVGDHLTANQAPDEAKPLTVLDAVPMKP